MEIFVPGIDSVYEPFLKYNDDADLLIQLTPSSGFMDEAAETVEKCAEYLTNNLGANVGTLDAKYHKPVASAATMIN